MRATLSGSCHRRRTHSGATLRARGSALRELLLAQLVATTFVAVPTALGLWLIASPHAPGLPVGLLDCIP